MGAITYDVDLPDFPNFRPAYIWTPDGAFIVVQPNGEILIHKRGAPEFERIDPAPTSP